MPTLLPHQPRSVSLAVYNDSAIEMASCFPQAVVTFSRTCKQSLLNLLLIIGLFVTFFHNSYNGLGRLIETSVRGSTINYYYDPEVEHRQLGSCGG